MPSRLALLGLLLLSQLSGPRHVSAASCFRCFYTASNRFSGPAPVSGAAISQRSQVLAFRRTAIMDTVTAILNGRVVSLCGRQPLPAVVQLATATTTLRAVATPDGRFRFFHIPAGKYTLTVAYPAYVKLMGAPVRLGSGDAAEITIGLGCRTGAAR